MSKYTPGSWYIGEDGDIFTPGACIAKVCGAPEGIKEANDNARLIAAAPSYHKHAHNLAMMVLQSDLYEDPDVREEVINVLAIWRRAEGGEE
jgi:hypothetical protein